jgi:hypothetical protein
MEKACWDDGIIPAVNGIPLRSRDMLPWNDRSTTIVSSAIMHSFLSIRVSRKSFKKKIQFIASQFIADINHLFFKMGSKPPQSKAKKSKNKTARKLPGNIAKRMREKKLEAQLDNQKWEDAIGSDDISADAKIGEFLCTFFVIDSCRLVLRKGG